MELAHTVDYVMLPYLGGFDLLGRYNVPLSRGRGMARFDPSFTPIDTIPVPEDPVERDRFFTMDETTEEGWSRTSVRVPFQGYMVWRFSPAGTVWTLLTGRYELAEMTTGGEMLRRVTKDHESIPVPAAEREEALKNLEWFTKQGGEIDLRKIPKSKPVTGSFFIDDEGNLWVKRVVASGGDDEGRLFDLFDAEGRYLGTLRLPFSPEVSVPEPIVRNGVLYGATSDEVGVPYLVRARIVKP